MISYSRMLDILNDWVRWMRRSETHKLGYPKKSIMMSSGGSSNEDSFDHMCEALDEHNCEIMNAVIFDLPVEERKAIFYKFFKQQPKPMYLELKLDMAYTNIINGLNKKLVI